MSVSAQDSSAFKRRRRRPRSEPVQRGVVYRTTAPYYYYAYVVVVAASSVFAFSSSSMPSSSTRGNFVAMFASSTTEPAVTLASLTVKELRQLVKDGLHERGVLTRLKRKQDLIEYLQQDGDEPTVTAETVSSSSLSHALIRTKTIVDSYETNVVESQVKRRQPLAMPARDDTSTMSTTYASPKDAIFQDVYARYPPVREQQQQQQQLALDDNNNYADDNTDVRQLYHPMLRSMPSNSSDMDLVFIGTASCTPGTTRGVSCTALRLNWRRRAIFLDTETGQQSYSSSNFQGGTWIFDVGECTQVSCSQLFLSSVNNDYKPMLAPVRQGNLYDSPFMEMLFLLYLYDVYFLK
jgi:hypothetical protein